MPTSENWLAFVIVNLAFAGAALSVGFFAGAWFLGGRKKKELVIDTVRQSLAVERTINNSARLCELAVSIVCDIGEHSSRVRNVTHQLESLDVNDVEATGAGLVAALAQIVAANNQLQHQLTEAEGQIRAQAEEIRSYELEARTDALTGLANRRAFDDELARRYSEWQRKSICFSLMILDLDHFKRLNDTYGHQVGDEVLRAVGKKLQQTCRGMDLPCRYGGEEFAVVMPATNAKDAGFSADRLRNVIENLAFEVEGTELDITCSVGVAQVLASDDIGRTLRRADEALYRSKAAGRNCSHVHDGQNCIATSSLLQGEPQQSISRPAASSVTQLLDSLSNRTRFIDELRRRIAETNRTGGRLSVMTVRLEGYGQVKRTEGSVNAAKALESAARALVGTLRESDLVARLNEQTFAVLMPSSLAADAAIAAERAWVAVDASGAAHQLSFDALKPLVGLATLKQGDTAESLVRRAEDDLINVESLTATSERRE
jgi:diguanylate cyclase